ncbi:unnamed protein product [Schistosoma margrebowiei]|uniref:Uncharacterized protein n=1 Tax=Schistosoma margrebowiei TaxID=48269 RepID=A0A183MAG8_9TREM|nr:unnamed protein product [Schistosoma margrebowiei]
MKSIKTFITITDNSSNSGVFIALYANDYQSNSSIYTKYPMNLQDNNNNRVRNNTSPSIYSNTNSNIKSISWINVNDNDLT